MSTRLFEVFHPDRDGLERRPGMNCWEKGCAMLASRLETWLNGYLAQWGAAALRPSDPGYADCLLRLWVCWRFHWPEAVAAGSGAGIDGLKIAERIRGERGDRRGRRLGGDPMRDVVLAEGVQRNDPPVIALFEREYKAHILGISVETLVMLARDAEGWWQHIRAALSTRLAKFADKINSAGLPLRPPRLRGEPLFFEQE